MAVPTHGNRHIAAPLLLALAGVLVAQPPSPNPAGAARGGPAGRGTPAAGPSAPAARGLGQGPLDQMMVDAEAANRGKSTYIAECITCHGPKARGTDQGVDLIRSQVVLHDRYGDVLGPLLKKGHPMQSGGQSASLSQDQVRDLSHFLRQRLMDTLNRGPGNSGNPAPNIVTGDAKAGEVYFSGAGKCGTCHQPAGDLKGIATRYAPVDLQQRFLFPSAAGGRGGRGGPATSDGQRALLTVTVTPPNGPAVTGVPDRIDDFNVTLRDSAGAFHSWSRTPNLKVEKHDPLAAHHALLAVIADKDIHDVVAYLETLK